MVFVTFRQEYGRTNTIKIYQGMKDIQKIKNEISWKGTRCKNVDVTQGLRQENPLLTIILNLVLEMLTRKSKIKMEETIPKNKKSKMDGTQQKNEF